MAKIEGKAEAALRWASGWPGLESYLKLNSLVTEDGEASLATSYNDVAVERYIDGTALREYTFLLKVVTAWSDGTDDVNAEAERLASSWLDWVAAQYPANVPEWPGAEITGIEPGQNAPILDAVYESDGLAQYAIQAVVTYIE